MVLLPFELTTLPQPAVSWDDFNSVAGNNGAAVAYGAFWCGITTLSEGSCGSYETANRVDHREAQFSFVSHKVS